MSDDVQVIRLDEEDVQVLRLDEEDDTPTIVYVPGTGAGVSEAELGTALAPYATRLYVDTAVSGGSLDAISGLIDTAVLAHRNAENPHPTYDDISSLRLRFLNGLI